MTPRFNASIIGAGMTPFGKFPERSLRSLATEAVEKALADADIPKSDVGVVFFANATAGILHGQEMIRAQSSLRETGLMGTPMINVENACASASSAFALAVAAVQSGTTDVALAVGAEKLTHPNKARSVSAIATAVDLEDDPEARRYLSKALLGWDLDANEPFAGDPGVGMKFMDVYAELTKAYMERSGATIEDLAAVAVKSHANGSRNPLAQYRNILSLEEILASREVAPPLRLLMCSPVGDGAAAVVVCSREYAERLGDPAVTVEAVAVASAGDPGSGREDAIAFAAEKAYNAAGITPHDLDVVELHDAAVTGELMGYEELGLCPVGDGPKLLASGATQLGGAIPVNPSGGLLSRGHPIGATGCAQLVELVDQLRGRAGERQVAGARLALAQNAGGFINGGAAASVVSILSMRSAQS
jgi:acetyl-CoA acetyltransferase